MGLTEEPKSPFQITSRYSTACILLLIAMVHMMIFAFFQTYGNFLNQTFLSVLIPLKVFFYTIVILTSISHQILVRMFTLKFTMIAGLTANIIGLILIWWSLSRGGVLPLIFISMFFVGIAFTSVINCLITYLVIEFPKRIIIAIMAMFAFGNMGNVFSNILFNAFKAVHFNSGFFILTISLTILAIAYIAIKFFDPKFPEHLKHLRKGTLLWKELHYRLALFILSIIAYGIVEGIFGVWSGMYLLKYLSQALTKDLVSIFWFSMVIGQLLLLIPLYYFPARRIFPFLILSLIFTLFFYAKQTELPGFLVSLIFGGIGCAAIFPILLSFMEEEVIEHSTHSGKENYLPYIETGTCLMVAGYLCGVALVDLWVLRYIQHPNMPMNVVFPWGIITICGLGLLSTYLNWSSSNSRE